MWQDQDTDSNSEPSVLPQVLSHPGPGQSLCPCQPATFWCYLLVQGTWASWPHPHMLTVGQGIGMSRETHGWKQYTISSRTHRLSKAGLANQGFQTSSCWTNLAQSCTVSSPTVSMRPLLAHLFWNWNHYIYIFFLFPHFSIPEIKMHLKVTVGEA